MPNYLGNNLKPHRSGKRIEENNAGFRKWVWEPALGFAALAALISLAIASPQQREDNEVSIEELPNSVREVIALQEAEAELENFETLDGFQTELFSWEPNIVNPVRLEVAPNGDVFVVESYRWDLPWMRNFPDREAQRIDFLSESLEVAQSRLRPSGIWSESGELRSNRSERIKLLRDLDQDGIADTGFNFAEGFSGSIDGIGGAVVFYGNEIWFAHSPQIWNLRDTENDGTADQRRSILFGASGRLSGSGDSMISAMAIGPDQRLYFGVNDRGIDINAIRSVNNAPPHIDLTRTGGIFSCELDGSDWKIVAWGLRAPGDLFFNETGDLFVSDTIINIPASSTANDSSQSGARIYLVTPGADFGWRTGYAEPAPIRNSSAWMSERSAFLSNAPADFRSQPILRNEKSITGITLIPKNSAFNVNTEQDSSSLVWAEVNESKSTGSIRRSILARKGAGYSLNISDTLLQPITATDVILDWKGGILLADWIGGTNAPYKGRIFRIKSTNTNTSEGPAGLDKFLNRRPELNKADWLSWLTHPDFRIRSMASKAIAERGPEWLPELESILNASSLTGSEEKPFQTLEAVRALAQIASKYPRAADSLINNARHPEPLTRAAIATALGLVDSKESIDALLRGIQDPDPGVRRRSVEALGKLHAKEAIRPILDRVRTIDGQDPVLRQAFVYALGAIGAEQELLDESRNQSPSVRLVATLALQRIQGSLAVSFLWDENSRVAAEASRAVYSDPDREAFERLADRIATPMDSSQLAYRTLWAHHRLGDPIRARALAFFAANPNAAENLRLEALTILSKWGQALERDPITGQKGWTPWVQLPANELKRTIDRAVTPYLNQLQQDESESIRNWVRAWRLPESETDSENLDNTGSDKEPTNSSDETESEQNTEKSSEADTSNKVIKT